MPTHPNFVKTHKPRDLSAQAARVKNIRENFLGVSQKKLAAHLGVSVFSIREYETGRIDPPFSLIRKLRATCIQVDLARWEDWMLFEDE